MNYYILLFLFITNSLYSIVIVDGGVDKKNIYLWQTVDYIVNFDGEADGYNAEGIDEKSITDFEVINKKTISETIHKDGERVVSKYTILYTLKPIRKGKLTIPVLDARYFLADYDNNFKRSSTELKEYKINVLGFGFLFIVVAQWIVIILIAALIYFKVIRKVKDIK